MISLENVWKCYRGQAVPALAGVSFHVDRGTICSVIGLSGAGKTTLVRCITGLERVDRGSIRVDSVDLTSLSGASQRQARQRIGVVFQHFNLLTHRTALGNVMFPMEISGIPAREARPRAEFLLGVVGLSDKASSYCSTLSGGQQQRVGIARALACKPSVILCDELTSALDPLNTRSILNLIQGISREFHVTVLMITHSLQVAQEICDSVVVMHEGKVVESGRTKSVFSSPSSGVLRSMLITKPGVEQHAV